MTQPNPFALALLLRATGRTPAEIATLIRAQNPSARVSSTTVESWMKQPGQSKEPSRPRWYLLADLADALGIARADLYRAHAGEPKERA